MDDIELSTRAYVDMGFRFIVGFVREIEVFLPAHLWNFR